MVITISSLPVVASTQRKASPGANLIARSPERRTFSNSSRVVFQQADINTVWGFATMKFDLTVFSLVLEHIENLEPVFKNLSESMQKGGYVYIGELHPFKQYAGTKARFETESGTKIVPCFTHNISDFTQVAARYGFVIKKINEYFDDNDRASIPRILTLLFQKQDSL